ncbi:hypothetical protein Q1695_011109 [Nippostrongylus brasiliensis]|nr:hypothetical protein Q1695_011109 [Nippostrongylus brasiliensis]
MLCEGSIGGDCGEETITLEANNIKEEPEDDKSQLPGISTQYDNPEPARVELKVEIEEEKEEKPIIEPEDPKSNTGISCNDYNLSEDAKSHSNEGKLFENVKEEPKPEIGAATLPPVQTTVPIVPVVNIMNGDIVMVNGLPQVYPTRTAALPPLEAISRGVPQIIANTHLIPHSGGLLRQGFGAINPQQLFSCNGVAAALTRDCFTPADILSTPSSTTITLNQHATVSQRRRAQGPSCHQNSRCANCRTTNTSLWRRNDQGEVECNACNLYYRKNKRPRPLALCKDTISKRIRKSADRQLSI